MDLWATAGLLPDPEDNMFCACAEQGGAAFVATLNRKDFPQKKLSACNGSREQGVKRLVSEGSESLTLRR